MYGVFNLGENKDGDLELIELYNTFSVKKTFCKKVDALLASRSKWFFSFSFHRFRGDDSSRSSIHLLHLSKLKCVSKKYWSYHYFPFSHFIYDTIEYIVLAVIEHLYLIYFWTMIVTIVRYFSDLTRVEKIVMWNSYWNDWDEFSPQCVLKNKICWNIRKNIYHCRL